jgi:hypothetical protein
MPILDKVASKARLYLAYSLVKLRRLAIDAQLPR